MTSARGALTSTKDTRTAALRRMNSMFVLFGLFNADGVDCTEPKHQENKRTEFKIDLRDDVMM